MPATAGRPSRMPHGNRVTTGDALRTNSIWRDVVKYDPYSADGASAAAEAEAEPKLKAPDTVAKPKAPVSGVHAHPHLPPGAH